MTQDIEMDRYATENREENRRYENSPHIECCICSIYLPKQNSKSSSKKMLLIIFGLTLIFVAIVLGLYFGIIYDTHNDMSETTTTTINETTATITQTSVTTIYTSTSKICSICLTFFNCFSR